MIPMQPKEPNPAVIDDAEIEIEEEIEKVEEELDPAAEPEADPQAEAAEETAALESEGTEPDDEVVVTIGDEQPEQLKTPAPPWAKELRKDYARLGKENARLRKKLDEAGIKPAAKGANALGKRPAIEDFDYDAARHDAALDEWYDKKKQAEEAERATQAEQTNAERAWTEKLSGHQQRAAKLRVTNYADAEETVFAALDQTQQGCLIQVSDKSEIIVLGLYGNPAKLQSLAAIKDPARFIYEIAKLETQLKTTTRRPATAPESRVSRGSAGKSTKTEAALEKLRTEAAKTGDYSKVHAYRRKMRAAN